MTTKLGPSLAPDAPQVAVIGAGAMGSLFGGLLAEGGLSVVLIDVWQEHVDAINSRGLRIVGHGGERTVPVVAATDPAAAANARIVLFQCKALHNRVAAASVKAAFAASDTVAISFQNGLGNEEELGEVLGADRVLGGLTAQGASIEAPGVTRNHTDLPTYIGEMDGAASERCARIAKLFSAHGLRTEAAEDIKRRMWLKLMANIALSVPSGACDLTISGIVAVPELVDTSLAAVDEALAVAKAEGQVFERDEALSVWRQITGPEGTGDNKSSLCHDLLNRRRSEIDYINGAVVRLGRKHGIPTPVNSTLCAIVKGIESRYADG